MPAIFSRGFGRRRPPDADESSLPPGQYLTRDFPILSAGPTPRTPLDEWSFTVGGAVDDARSWTWTGVSVDTLLEGTGAEADYVTAWSDGGYTTNLPLEDVSDGKAWVVYEYDGEACAPSRSRRAFARASGRDPFNMVLEARP